MNRERLAVIGSPIAHSQSPRLHGAAYEVLGLPWNYQSIDVTSATLEEFVQSLGSDWRGLSVTMPLKHAVVPLLDRIDPTTRLTGVANTVVFSAGGSAGYNTDVEGVMQPLIDAGMGHPSHVLVLGAGATASSAVTAAARLDAETITVAARNAEKAATLVELASEHRASVRIVPLGDVVDVAADVVVNTLPGGVADALPFSFQQRQASVLLDVIYDPWPTALVTSWMEAGGRVIPGIEMLVAQALRQVRLFVGGDQDVAVDREPEVVSAMRASVGLAPGR